MNARPFAVADGDGRDRHVLAHDLLLPTLLFAALGGMTWAVRGCSGFGAVPGCIFMAGVAWWHLLGNRRADTSRPERAGGTFGISISEGPAAGCSSRAFSTARC